MPCAESGIRTFVAGVALLRVERPHDQQARQLAAGARRRLQRGARHAGDLAQRLLEPPQQLERALHGRVGLVAGAAAGSPGSAATVSAIFGLYFIVHEPSG